MRSNYLGPWRIDLEWRQGVPRLVPGAILARAVAAALDAAGAPSPASIGLILSDDVELTLLNESHMGKTGPTDVLSFPLLPPAAFPDHADRAEGAGPPGVEPGADPFVLPPGARLNLGDIVISIERAIEQAAAGRGGQTGDVRWEARDELRLLAIHGTLHICGWDHAEAEEEAAMRDLERRLLA